MTWIGELAGDQIVLGVAVEIPGGERRKILGHSEDHRRIELSASAFVG